MNEAEHFRRQWRLYQTLTGNPSGKTGVELAEVFGVSSKTIQRDVATLRAVVIPVEEVVEQRGRKRWKGSARHCVSSAGIDSIHSQMPPVVEHSGRSHHTTDTLP